MKGRALALVAVVVTAFGVSGAIKRSQPDRFALLRDSITDEQTTYFQRDGKFEQEEQIRIDQRVPIWRVQRTVDEMCPASIGWKWREELTEIGYEGVEHYSHFGIRGDERIEYRERRAQDCVVLNWTQPLSFSEVLIARLRHFGQDPFVNR